MMDIAVTVGTWERLERTDVLGTDPRTRSILVRARLLSEMFLCLVYPREVALKELRDALSKGTEEHAICAAFADKESEYRRLRNALAHGSFEIEGERVSFLGRIPSENLSVPVDRVRLDCLLIFDVLMAAYEARNPGLRKPH